SQAFSSSGAISASISRSSSKPTSTCVSLLRLALHARAGGLHVRSMKTSIKSLLAILVVSIFCGACGAYEGVADPSSASDITPATDISATGTPQWVIDQNNANA